MKAFLMVLAVVFAGTMATTLGHSLVETGVTAVAGQAAAVTSEPAAILLSGSALLGLAGALKRLMV
jgi:hypothetical protein